MPSKLSLALFVAGTLAGAALAADSAKNLAVLEQRFAQLDKDGDGKLTAAETGNAEWFTRLDRTGKGYITREDIRVLARLVAIGAGKILPGEPESEVADDSPRQGPKLVKPAERGVGRLVADLSFTDVAGQTGKLSDFKSRSALVIAFTSTSCPVTKKYAPALARLEKEFAAKGVAFLFVNPIASDSAASIKEALADNGFSGRYVHDRDGKLTPALGVQSTAEILVLDAARTLVFRGALDDQYGLGYSLEAPRHPYARDALAAVLAHTAPAIAATEAPGCALDTPVAPASASANAVTYHGRISRIVQANCLECHHTGGLGPFSLETYDDVKSHAGMMRKQVTRGAMPPWFAAPAVDASSPHWSNDRSLTAGDKADLLAWLAGDKPLGNPADAPLPRAFPTEWDIGTPDAILRLPHPVAVQAEGVMPYQTLTVQTAFTEDKWVQAFQVRPTAREVVHHVIVRVHARGTKVGGEEGEGGARDGFLAAYVPGNSHITFPPGFAKRIPAGAIVSFQMHYTPNGKATSDQTQLGLVFAKEPPRHTIHVAGLATTRINIPAGAPNHEEVTSITLSYDTTLLSFTPHMHLRGKAARYEATLPDGTRKLILDIPHYDFNWQLTYKLAEPITLPRGAKVTYHAWYDNSPGNPANPDPAKNVRWGPQTFDEMMLGYVEYYLPGQPKVAPAARLSVNE